MSLLEQAPCQSMDKVKEGLWSGAIGSGFSTTMFIMHLSLMAPPLAIL